MEHLRFAICVVMPGATSPDIVTAAMVHNVHIIDKEQLDPIKDYSDFPDAEMPGNGSTIFYLFAGSNWSILAHDDATRIEALHMILPYCMNAML